MPGQLPACATSSCRPSRLDSAEDCTLTTTAKPTPKAATKVYGPYVGGMPSSRSAPSDLSTTLPGHVAVGQLCLMWRNGLLHDNVCSCSNTYSRCPFWNAVGERPCGGWHNIDGQ